MIYLRKCDEINGCGNIYPGDMNNCPKCGACHSFSDPAPVNPRDYGWDEETYPNCYTVRFVHINTDQRWKFEISDRINQIAELVTFVYALRDCKARLVGYNNVGFDYPVLHYIVYHQYVGAREIYDFAMVLIKGSKDEKFSRMIWESDRLVEQLDLIMIWHYNKENKEAGTEPTSLKALEIAMRMDIVEDLPFPAGTILTHSEMDILHEYNLHDVIATIYFYVRSLAQIKLREELSVKFGKNFINMSNTKMGGEILMIECEKSGIQFYERINGIRQKRQTIRPSINLAECVFPYVKFEHPEFERIRQYFISKTITETKGVFKGLECNVGGLTYVFGTGGLHASVDGEIFETNDTHQIIDVDVKSFYPRKAIVNKLYAEHLGVEFCDAYNGVYITRTSYEKGTPENAAYKEALNANYGNSNNKFSVFLDPKFTMTITINGQLLLCMLIEQLVKVPGLQMIQANTDGVTFFCLHEHIEHTRSLCRWWESLTCLELEEELYNKMCVRDVNNYLSVKTNGKVKRIGCYAHERMDENPGTREIPYGKDPSMLVVAKAAEAALIYGKDIREFIINHEDNYDFMCRAKAPRSNKLMMRWPEYDNAEIQLNNIVRYYVSNDGGSLVKIAPPTGTLGTWKRATKVPDELYHQVMSELNCKYSIHRVYHEPDRMDQYPKGHDDRSVAVAPYLAQNYIIIDGEGIIVDSDGIPHDPRIHTKNKSKHTIREMGICVGWSVTDCSDVKMFDRSTLNYEYYIAEAEKIVKPLLNQTVSV